MSCSIAMAKFTSQDFIGQNNIQTHGTSTMSMILAGARAHMLAEDLEQKKHMEVRDRIIVEAHAGKFLLRVREFILRVRACTEAHAVYSY